MQTRNRNSYTTIRTEGALLPVDILQRIQENDSSLEGLTPQSYYLAPGEKMNEAINRSWNRMTALWKSFQAVREQLGEDDPATGVTRERWLLPLFQELGYGRLLTSRAVEIDGKSYPVSHNWNNIPLHLIGCGLKLDKITPGAAGAARINPHAMLQEYLNRTEEAQWGLVTNGLILRLLRDNASLTRQAYLEFDLELMFNGEVYADFVLLWLVCHSSRFTSTENDPECILEKWSKTAQEHGTRALDDLRKGVEEAIRLLGQGFLQHPENETLRHSLQTGSLDRQDYYRQVLRLVYRLIFLFTAEDRGLLLDPRASETAKQRYLEYYSTETLRHLAQKQRGSRHHDRYEILRLVMEKLASNEGSPELALPALGGLLFSQKATAAINQAKLSNQVLLDAVRSLSYITEGNIRRTVDYRNLGPEELGSVYESLLELHPDVNTQARTFSLTSAAGNERKTSGSYYTPSSLIKVLLDSALEPVITDRLQNLRDSNQREQTLLSLKICDPACGSGHFLIAAAHRLAGRLASIRANGSEPSPEENRAALRDVIRRCIYGVDLNPMAVELCKVNLWLESIEPGKPLSFLDAHIQCGNSLVGVGPKTDYTLIPDEAFNAVTGDHKTTANYLKRRNKAERAGNIVILPTTYVTEADGESVSDLSLEMERINNLPEDTAEQVRFKEIEYTNLVETHRFNEQKTACDLWTAAFFWQIKEQPGEADVLAPTQGLLQRFLADNPIPETLLEKVNQMAEKLKFFHWELRFPEVFPNMPDQHSGENGGFDCVLGNPPWEKINLKDEEYFAKSHPKITAARTKAVRKKLIKELAESSPDEFNEFLKEQAYHDNLSNYFRFSEQYPLTGVSRINLYSIFSELDLGIISDKGRLGLVVASGIATDDNNKAFFQKLINDKKLISIYDFENRKAIFPNVDRTYKFSLFCAGGGKNTLENPNFMFFLTDINQISEKHRMFTLSPEDLQSINPLSRTCPTYKNKYEAEISKKIHRNIDAWCLHEKTHNWPGNPKTPFNLSNDSNLFMTKEELNQKKLCFINSEHANISKHLGDIYLPLYESKLIHQFNHRYSSFEGVNSKGITDGNSKELSIFDLLNPHKFIEARYWIKGIYQIERYSGNWFLTFRMITKAVNERTSIATIIPGYPCGNSLSIIENLTAVTAILLCSNMNTFVYDFIARHKIGGFNFNHWIWKQLPIIHFNEYSKINRAIIFKKSIELIYSAYDLLNFANEFLYEIGIAQWNEWFPHNSLTTGQLPTPFPWDEDRRALLRAELDAYYAYLYGLDRDELRYILDPQDVYGPDFPGETFRVLKDKEIRKYGEYRTRRLVLEAWDRMVADGTITPGERPVIEPQSAAPTAPETAVKETPAAYEAKPTPAPKTTKAKPQNPAQPALGGMSLTKCEACGAYVLSFEQQDHIDQVHGGQTVGFKQIG